MRQKTIFSFFLFILICSISSGQKKQWVEGFDSVVFHYNANRSAPVRDFRGTARGYMTAGWWAAGQMEKNILSWRTAVVPQKEQTTFAFYRIFFRATFRTNSGPRSKIIG